MTEPLWTPDAQRVRDANVTVFMRRVAAQHGVELGGYRDLHRFSIEQPGEFWSALWDFVDVIGERGDGAALLPGAAMHEARWFPNARFNFAENLLRGNGSQAAIHAWNEQGRIGTITRAQVRGDVAQLARALQAEGVTVGDRVAGFMPNIAATATVMLACASIGAVWSVCANDLAPAAAIERFRQIDPVVLFLADGAWYGGRAHDARAKGRAIAAALGSVRRVVTVPYLGADGAGDAAWNATDDAGAGDARSVDIADFTADRSREAFAFERFPFAQPLYILYTSGTTGRPKCIVHGAGGTLMKHQADHVLQFDVRPGDAVLRVTGSGWMLWNSLMSVLAANASIVLYDGSPLHPASIVLDMVAREHVAMLGLAPPVIEGWMRAGLQPSRTHDLSALRSISAGGAPLSAETARWVHREVKRDVHLASPSGGTDILSFFVGGDPIGPTYAGQIQAPALGMAVDVWNDAGRPLRGEAGELVCTRPFPSMPLGFWGDASGERFHAAYFDAFPGVWRHGDWAEITPEGGFVIHGRSDATLKVNGVRIGTAEIYAPLRAIADIVEAVAVEQKLADRTRIVLFVVLAPRRTLDAALEQKIRSAIAMQASPRHVPEAIVPMPDVPRTGNGKPSEIATRASVNGERVLNEDSLANPAVLALYREFGRADSSARLLLHRKDAS